MEVVASALGIIAALVAAIRWLMKINFKQSKEILQTKKDLYSERFEGLKKVTNELEASLKDTKLKLDKVMETLNRTRLEVENTKDKMSEYVETTEKKMSLFQSTVVQLSKDLILIKSTKPKG